MSKYGSDGGAKFSRNSQLLKSHHDGLCSCSSRRSSSNSGTSLGICFSIYRFLRLLPRWMLPLLLLLKSTAAISFPPPPCATERPNCLSGVESPQCDCHRTCRFFGSCCANANSSNNSDGIGPSGRLARELFECSQTNKFGQRPRYIVTKCPATSHSDGNARNVRLAVLCNSTSLHEFGGNFDSRFWPVSSIATGLTYRSIHCALCHGETSHTVETWSAVVNCSNSQTSPVEREQLRLCDVAGFKPPKDRHVGSHCWPGMIDRCQLSAAYTAATTTAFGGGGIIGDGTVPSSQTVKQAYAEACQTMPQLVILWNEKPYRNHFCAKCAGATHLQLKCRHQITVPSPEPIYSMQSLLDPAGPLCRGCGHSAAFASAGPNQLHPELRPPNKHQGNHVEVPLRKVCRGGEFYDWLAGQCRSFCLFGDRPLPDGGVGCADDDDDYSSAALSVGSSQSQSLTSTDRQTLPPLIPHSPAAISTTAKLPKDNAQLFDRRACVWQSYEHTKAQLLLNGNDSAVQSGVFELNASMNVHGVVSSQIFFTLVKTRAHNVLLSSAVSPSPSVPSFGYFSPPYAAADSGPGVALLTVCSLCRWQRMAESEAMASDVAAATGSVRWKQQLYAPPLIRHFESSTILLCVDAADKEYLLLHSPGSTAANQTDGGSRCSAAMDATAVALMCVSIVCLTIHAIAFCFVPSLRNLPGRVVFSQVIALLIAYSLNLLRNFAAVPAAGSSADAIAAASSGACFALAVVVHYFLLAYFAWTLMLAVEIHGAVRGIKQDSSGTAPRFVAYSLAGWLLPLAIVVAALATDRFGSENMRPGYGPPHCWMNNSYGFVLFFQAPLCAIVLTDIALYVAIVVRLVTRARAAARAVAAIEPRGADRERVVLSVKLLLALGLLWTVAVFGALSGDDVVLCVFSNVLNASQGVFVFAIFFCSHSSVRKSASGWLRRLSLHRRQRMGQSPAQQAAVTERNHVAGGCYERSGGAASAALLSSNLQACDATLYSGGDSNEERITSTEEQ